MQDFDFHMPTRVLFGEGRIEELESNIAPRFKRILIVTEKNVARLSGAVEAALAQLSSREFTVFTDVEENPPFSVLESGRKLGVESGVQMVIGIGGGSAMDAAKGIAVLASNEGHMEDFMDGHPLTHDPLPVVCIPTTSGTGSEVTPYAVFTDREKKTKGGFTHPKLFPVLSVVDPTFTYSMPERIIVGTGLDALTHAIEAALSTLASPMSDMIAIESIQTVLKSLKKASQKDEQAMGEMAYASMLAGIAITHGGTILLHIMGYPLTVFHGIHHGTANAILLPAFMNYMKTESRIPRKVERIECLFNSFGGVEAFVTDLGVSTRLSDYGITESEIEQFAGKVIVKGDIEITPADVTEEAIAGIYRSMM